jgi:hypothetical protein
MPNVRIDQQRIWVDSESRPLLHGEVHYWRLSPARWSAILDAVGELGLDMVSSYVCWDFHELSPGEFDFSGRTDAQRNLVGFIALVASKGMWLVLRPGPYIYAEWRNSGVPDYAVQYHRAHPEFRRAAERYMTAVVEVFKPYLATRGGPIVLVQADNEADPWADSFGAQLGLCQQPGPFQEFLRARYGDIGALNRAWGTALRSFDDARAVQSPLNQQRVPRYLDVVRFYHHHSADVVRWTADTYRRLGVDVPIYANTYSGFGVQHWPMIAQSVDLMGPDVYPTAEFRGEPLEHRRMLERIRFSRTCAPLAYIPEFEAGIWHGWHEGVGVLLANQYRLICLSALLAGAAGWGWYMLVNRDNWYMSPIDELGRARPDLVAEFADIVRVFRAMDAPGLVKLTDTAVAMDVLQLGARVAGPPGEGILEALYQADVDYECFDVDTGRIEKPLLFLSSGEWPSPHLVDYVERGGTLVVFDADTTGLVRMAEGQPLAIQLGEQRVTCRGTLMGWYADAPGEPIRAERMEEPGRTQQGTERHRQLSVGEQYVVGFREARGGGSIVRLGLQPSAELVLGLHQWLGVDIPSRAAAASTALFAARGGERYLVVVNHSDAEREVFVQLREAARRAIDLFGGMVSIVDGGFVVQVARKSGTVVRLD